MTDEELLNLNRRGFIPGPDESEESLRKRANEKRETLPREHLEWTREQLNELFDFSPDSLDIVYSNKQLAPWHGAACWVEEGRAKLQLREGFRKGTYLGLYSRDEVLAHEAVHAARLLFNEPENEEFFAYASSPKAWRRALGPIVKRPWEVWVWAVLLMFGMIWEIGFFLAACWTLAGFVRLIRQHLIRKAAASHLMKRLKSVKKTRAVLFRMTDEEIRKLSRGNSVDGDASLRWRLIRLAYFNHSTLPESKW
jgi:hypothetical protein